MSEESTTGGTKLDAVTAKYAESFESFSNSKSGNLILDFVMFKRSIVPYTLQILYVLCVALAWLAGIAGLIGKGPIGDYFSQLVEKTVDGKTSMVLEVSYVRSLIASILIIVFAPFVFHYVLEIVKFLWGFILHVYEKVLIPIWQTIVIRFLANVAPQIFPFLYERFMKVVDIVVDRAGPALDAVIDGIVAIAMTIAALLKGLIWLPYTLGQRLARWANKSNTEEAK